MDRKPVALLPFEKVDFNKDDDEILKQKIILESNFLDQSLKDGIAVLEKKKLLEIKYKKEGISTSNSIDKYFSEGEIKFNFFELGLKTGIGVNQNIHTTNYEQSDSAHLTPGGTFSKIHGYLVLHDGSYHQFFTDPNTQNSNRYNLNYDNRLYNYHFINWQIVRVEIPIQWNTIAGVVLQNTEADSWVCESISLNGISNDWGTRQLIADMKIGAFLRQGTNHSITGIVAPKVPSLTQLKFENNFSPEDDYSLYKLKTHLIKNQYYYNRIIQLNKDINERTEEFETTPWGLTPNNNNWINHVAPIALEVFGSKIAYPLLTSDKNSAVKLKAIYDAVISIDPEKNKWALEQMKGFTEADFNNLAVQAMQTKAKTEKLISFPTKGIFAEGKLGHCNISEEIDNTRFWKWEEHPIPINAPDINPVTPVTPQNIQQNVQPTPFPNSLVNIVTPSAAPDPQGLAEALKVIATPNIFRDMSGRQETADLIKKLGDGSIDFNEAVKKAKEIEEKYGKDLAGSNNINSPSSVESLKNVQQLSDANKSLVGYARPETIKQNANKISDSYADLADLVKQEKVQELDERLALNGNGVITNNISIEVPVIFKAINIRDKKAIPNNPSTLITDNFEIPISNLPFSNWAQDGVEQYGSRAIQGRINTIKGIVLHETAGFNWTGVQSGLSVQFHINRDGKTFQHNDAHSKCQHIHLLNGSHVGIEHVNDPFHQTPEITQFEELPRQKITWGYGSNWLTIPPSEQLKSSALFIQELINKLSISQKWCQLLEVDTDLINTTKYSKNSRSWLPSNQKNRIHFLINTGGNNFFVQHCRNSNKNFDGIIAHAVAFETNSPLNHNDGSIYAFYSWLVIEKKIPHQQALNILQGYLTNDDNIVQATLKFSTGGNAFFVDVTDII